MNGKVVIPLKYKKTSQFSGNWKNEQLYKLSVRLL